MPVEAAVNKAMLDLTWLDCCLYSPSFPSPRWRNVIFPSHKVKNLTSKHRKAELIDTGSTESQWNIFSHGSAPHERHVDIVSMTPFCLGTSVSSLAGRKGKQQKWQQVKNLVSSGWAWQICTPNQAPKHTHTCAYTAVRETALMTCVSQQLYVSGSKKQNSLGLQ